MVDYNLFSETLCLPPQAMTYEVSRRLAERYPDLILFETDDSLFDVTAFAKAGHCELTEDPSVHSEVVTSVVRDEGLSARLQNGAMEVEWRGIHFDIVTITLANGQIVSWILSESKTDAERFLVEVCDWNAEVRDEVLVYEGGFWAKSPTLLKGIKGTTFENLILRDELKTEFRKDLERFFNAKSTYERFSVPWKRGIVLIGPPGNGKTHAIKALINATGKPCLYVKSFKSCCETEHDAIREIFDRARRSAPCILVFEDLDSLINDSNRSFFLNELDGFAANVGVVTVATTNHPDRLDPAILDRPSRFDRKYHFPLPEAKERAAYLQLWNASIEPSIALNEAELAEVVQVTEGYSFAYLKELLVTALVSWIENESRRLSELIHEFSPRLRSEMADAHKLAPVSE